ncbi:MAG: efflux RND transporter permease subunit, partial [Myxococcota bacterium]
MIADILKQQPRLIMTLALSLAIGGILCWFLMPREEDPTFPNRAGMIIVTFPGADALTLEEQVVKPLEEELAGVQGIKHVEVTLRADVAIVSLQLQDLIYDVAPVWDDVEDALEEAQRQFPAGVLPVETDWELIINRHAVVLAITGSDDRLKLTDAADEVKEKLLTLPDVSKVALIADAGRQVTVALDEEVARSSRVTPASLVQALQGRTRTIPGGSINAGGQTLIIDPGSSLDDLEAIASTPVLLPTGTAVELRELATVQLSPEEPTSSLMRVGGVTAAGLGIIPRQGIDAVAFGRSVRKALDEARTDLAQQGLDLAIVTFQPDYVEARLANLGQSLLIGIGIVALVLVLAMGLRLGLVVATVIPLVTFSSLAVYAASGGVLHQISIAALVLALGLLVDNAIVVAERIQWRIDHGETNVAATVASIEELFLPLLSATGTTMASFLPLLLSVGPSGDFTRAIPTLVMLTLAVSFVFAVLVTPTMAMVL